MGSELRECPSVKREAGHADRAMQFCSHFRTAIDGGAHRGYWTHRLWQRFSRVMAFEPRESFAASNPYPCIRAALGDIGNGCARMHDGPDNDGQAHLVQIGEVEPGDTGRVAIAALDNYDLSNVDFIKLDVEGYELMALRGAQRTIALSHPVIVVEQNGLSARYGYTDADLTQWLAERGYHQVARYNKDHVYVCDDR